MIRPTDLRPVVCWIPHINYRIQISECLTASLMFITFKTNNTFFTFYTYRRMQILWYHFIIKFLFIIKNILIFRNSSIYHLFIKIIFTPFKVAMSIQIFFWKILSGVMNVHFTICFFFLWNCTWWLSASIFTFKGDVLYQIECSLYFEWYQYKKFSFLFKMIRDKRIKEKLEFMQILFSAKLNLLISEDTWNFQIMLTLAYLDYLAWQFFFL